MVFRQIGKESDGTQTATEKNMTPNFQETLRTASTCHSIVEKEADALFQADSEYNSLSKEEKDARLREVKNRLGNFLANAYDSVRRQLEEGTSIPPKNKEELKTLYFLICDQIWKEFRPAPQHTAGSPSETESVQSSELKRAAGILFRALDSKNKSEGILNCATSAYLTAQLMESFKVSVGLIGTDCHLMLGTAIAVPESPASDSGNCTGLIFENVAETALGGTKVFIRVYDSEQEITLKNFKKYTFLNMTPFFDDNSSTNLAIGNVYFDGGDYENAVYAYARASGRFLGGGAGSRDLNNNLILAYKLLIYNEEKKGIPEEDVLARLVEHWDKSKDCREETFLMLMIHRGLVKDDFRVGITNEELMDNQAGSDSTRSELIRKLTKKLEEEKTKH